jgi:hypothetical protein
MKTLKGYLNEVGSFTTDNQQVADMEATMQFIKEAIGQHEHDETGDDIRIQTRNAFRRQLLRKLAI